IKISVLVDREDAQRALHAVHNGFDLHITPEEAEDSAEEVNIERTVDVSEVVARLRHMEDLTIDSITLDSDQGILSLRQIPDEPGIAARALEAVAADGIVVDMIVQNISREGYANLSFTFPQEDYSKAVTTAERIGEALKAGQVLGKSKTAKLSVSGIGLRSHTGVGIRMFKALSDAGINIDLINTSEVQVNVIIDEEKGPVALAALKEVFAEFCHGREDG
ncbi:MAG: ACT domain-containing protein, partial [Pirellulaceae bacterium]